MNREPSASPAPADGSSPLAGPNLVAGSGGSAGRPDAAPVLFGLVAAVAAGVFLTWLATLCRIMPQQTMLLLVGVAVLGIPWPATPPVVLALLMAILADSPGHWLQVLPAFGAQLSFAELALSACFVLYAGLVYRFQRCREDARRRRKRSESADGLSDAGDWLALITAGFVLATVARWILPVLFVGRAWSGSFHLVPAVAGFLVALVILGLGSALWIALVRLVGRSGMDAREARLVLNQVADEELGSDFRLIARRQADGQGH